MTRLLGSLEPKNHSHQTGHPMARCIHRTLLTSMFLAMLPTAALAAGGDIAWQFGDTQPGRQEATASASDQQDNLVLTGYAVNASEDFHTVKLLADGSGVAWRATFDRAGYNDRAMAVAVDSRGDVIVAGSVNNGVNTDFHVIKYCGETRTGTNACTGGDVLWQHSLDGPQHGNDQAVAVVVDPLDNIYIGGYTQGVAASDDFMIVKYHDSGPGADGAPTWKVVRDANGGEDRITAIAASASGLAVTGYSQTNGPASDFDMLTVRYAADGSELWQRTLDGGAGDDRGWVVDLAPNGTVTASATSYNGSIKEIRTLRYAAADGATLWQRAYSGGNLSEPMALATDAAGDTYLAGVTFTATGKNDYYIARYRSVDGFPVWETLHDSGTDNADVPTDIAVDEQGDVYVTGYAHKSVAGDDDFLTLKLKRDNGIILWNALFNGPGGGDDQAAGMAVGINIASSGDIYVAGWSEQLPLGQGNYDFYGVKYDAGLLNAPTSLVASTVAVDTVSLTWADNANNEDQFIIERCAGIGCTNFAQIATTAVNENFYTDTTVGANIWYSYRVAASSAAAGASHFSHTASTLTTVMNYAAPIWIFQHNGPENADDRAMAIAVGNDHHPVVTGSQLSPGLGSGGFDYLTVKIDRATAQEMWSAGYNDPDDELDVATCIAVDSNSDIVVSGYSSLYGGGGVNTNDILTLKYAASGPQPYGTPHLWSDQYNGPAGDDDRSSSIDTATDNSGNIVVVGYGRNALYNDDLYVVKYATDGSRLWAATPYDNGGNDYPGDVVFDAAGDILVSGTTWKNGSYDLFLAKYAAATGQILWVMEYDHAGLNDGLNDLDVDPAGNVYVTGFVTGGDGDTDQYIAKFNGSTGAPLWPMPVIVDGGGNLYDEAVVIRYDRRADAVAVGGSVTTATGWSDFAVSRYDSDGNMLWNKILDRSGADDLASAMGMDHDGNVCLTGNTDDNIDTDILAVCYDPAGNLIGSLLYNGAANGDDFAEDVAVNSFGEMFIAGATTNAAGNTDYLVMRGDSDVMVSPDAFTANPGFATVTLAWQDNTTQEDGFHLWRKTGTCNSAAAWQAMPDLAVNQENFTDQNLTPGDSYCYRLQAFTSAGRTSPFSVEIETTTLVPTIANCTATPSGTTGIALAWTDQTSTENGFLIERCTGSSCIPADTLVSLAADSQAYTDTTICTGSTASYRISAVGDGWSAACLVANVTPAAIQPPALTAVTAISESRIDITWTSANQDADGNRIYRCEGAGCTPPTGVGNEFATVTTAKSGAVLALDMEEASWAGAGAVIDSSGNSNHATASGHAAPIVAGHTGRGGTFDGNGDFVQWSYATGRPTNSFTMAAWVKATSSHGIDPENTTGTGGTGGQRYLFWPDHMGGNSGAGVSIGTNGISVYEHGEGYMPALAVYSATLPAGWNHIAVTYTNKQPRIYLNGALVRTGLASPRATVYAPVILGGGSYGWHYGQTDEVRVFDRALSAAEITTLKNATLRSYTDTTAQAGHTYRYQVTAYKDASCPWETPASGVGEAATILADPCPLTVAASSTSSVSLGWTDRYSAETSYSIERCAGVNCDFTTIDKTLTAAANQTSLADTTVCAGQTYGYRLTAIRDQAPTWSSATCTAALSLGAATAPSGFSAVRISEQQINLAWTDTTADETGFTLERCEGATCDFSTSIVIPLAANSTSHNDTGRTVGVTYRYRIRAEKTGACGWPSADSTIASASASFDAPLALTARPRSSTRIDLSWADTNATETGFAIDRCEGATCDFSVVTTFTVAANITDYSDTSACAGTTYRYQIRALDSGPGSSPSTPVTVSTLQATPPDNLLATAASESVVELTWNDNTIDEDGFVIERCDDALATCMADPGALFTPLPALPTVSPQAAPSGQTLWLHMDEAAWNGTAGEAKDASGNNLHGYRVNQAQTVAGGVNGRAATFDGSLDRIELGNQTLLKIIGNQTIAFWIKPANFNARRSVLAKAYAGEFSITLETDGTLHYYYGTVGSDSGTVGTTYQDVAMASPVAAGTWTHVAIVRDFTAMKLRWYKNGVLINETPALFATAKAGNNVTRIGYGFAGSYHGELDDVSIFARALAAEEISGEYQRFMNRVLLHMEDQMWDNAAGGVTDDSGLDNHGTMSGAVTAAAGRYGNGALFAGAGDMIDLGDINELDAPTALTVSLWFNRAASSTAASAHGINNVLVSQSSQAVNGNLEIGTEGSAVEFYLDSLNGTDGIKSVEAGITDGVWHHLALTYDSLSGSGAILYVDGKKIGQWTDFAGPLDSSLTSPLTIGMSRPDGTLHANFAGIIDEVAISTQGLSANEIRRQAEGWYTDSGLAPGSIHTYRVRAYKNGACGWDEALMYSEPQEITTQAPALSGDLTAVQSGSNLVRLDWTDTTDSETEYIVLRCQGADCTPAELTRLTSDSEWYVDDTVCTADSYTYQVVATDGVWTAASNNATVTVVSPASPTGLTLARRSETEVELVWNDPITDESGYRISRCSGSGCTPAGVIGTAQGSLNENFSAGIAAAAWNQMGQLQTVSAGTAPISLIDAYGASAVSARNGAVELATSSTGLGADQTWNMSRITAVDPAVLGNGDFDLTVDYTLPAGDIAAAFVQYHVFVRLQVSFPTASGFTSPDFLYIDRAHDNRGGIYNGTARINDTTQGLAVVTTDTGGKLRLTRTGQKLAALYWNGSGWTTLFTHPLSQQSGMGPTELIISQHVERNENPAIRATIDNVAVTSAAGISRHLDAGLTHSTPYTYRVYPFRGACEWPNLFSENSITTVIPAPTGLTAGSVNTTQVPLTWNDTTSSESGFELERCQGVDCSFTSPTVFAIAADQSAYTDSTAQPATTYSYRIRPVKTGDPAWPSDLYSTVAPNIATAATTAAAPAALAASRVSEAKLALSWLDNANDESGFVLERAEGSCDFTGAAQIMIAANSTAYNDTDPALKAETLYCYRISAYKDDLDPGTANNGWLLTAAGTASATTTITAPDPVIVTAFNTTRIDLSWTDNTVSETGFAIFRCEGAGCTPAELVTTTGANVTSFQDLTVCNGRQYTYQIQPQRSGFWPPPAILSQPATVTTPAALPPASFASFTPAIDTIQLTWEDGYSDETGYELERCSGAQCTGFGPLALPGADSVSYNDTGMGSSESFCYQLRAKKTGPVCGWQTDWVSICQTSLMPAPTGLMVTPAGSMKISMVWTDNSSDEDGFIIEEKIAEGRWVLLDLTGHEATSYTATIGISGGTSHTYRVRAYRGNDISQPTGEGSATTPAWQAGDNTCTQ